MPKDGASVPVCDLDQVVNRRYLTKRWEAAFGAPPPPFLSLRLMRKALIYDEQCRTYGGLQAGPRLAPAPRRIDPPPEQAHEAPHAGDDDDDQEDPAAGIPAVLIHWARA